MGSVSRCLNNHPSVAPQTRARVLSVAKQLSYTPHAYAQRLASKKTNTISTIIPYFTNYFFVQILEGVQDKAAQLGFDLILYGVNNPAQAEYYLRRSLHSGHVDGVMFFSMKFPENYVAKFQQINLPLVLVDASHEKFDSIRIKNREGALVATRHLMQLGHRNIAMINASLDTQPARERLDGYSDALEEGGIPFSMDNVIVSDTGKQDGFNREAGRVAMRQLLPRLNTTDPITAVFVASDVQALGVLDAALEMGVRVPEDLAVVSFDDIEMANHAQLTTMRQPMYDMGVLALEKLLDRTKNLSAPPTLTTFLPELIVRKSCGSSAKSNIPVSPGGIELEQSL
ncbi:MAG: LacI family DNA-binding transcriptional regulator [Bacteroidota bacterium]